MHFPPAAFIFVSYFDGRRRYAFRTQNARSVENHRPRTPNLSRLFRLQSTHRSFPTSFPFPRIFSACDTKLRRSQWKRKSCERVVPVICLNAFAFREVKVTRDRKATSSFFSLFFFFHECVKLLRLYSLRIDYVQLKKK